MAKLVEEKPRRKKGKAGGAAAGLGEFAPVLPRSLCIAERDIQISPLVMGELPAVFVLIKPIREALGDLKTFTFNKLLEVMATPAADALIDLVAIGCRQPNDWIRGLTADQFLPLLSAVFEVNSDFFLTKVLPAFGQMTGALGERLAGE